MNAPLFLANLALTVVMLAVTLWTGKTGRRRAHFTAAPSTVVVLALAIWQAELFGKGYDFDTLRLRVHLICAGLALASLPGTVWSGLKLVRHPQVRAVHRRWVFAFVVLTVLAVLTAGWMFLSATPKSA